MVSQSREKDIGDLVARGIVAKVLSRLLSEPDTETQVYIERVATPDLDGADELVSRRSRVHSTVVGLRRAVAELDAGAVPAMLAKAGAPPYETEYGMAHVFMKVQTMADVAGFYRAFGLDLATAHRERPDHVAAELEFLHFLLLLQASALTRGERDAYRIVRQAETAFLRDHLALWGPSYLEKVATFDADSIAARVVRIAARFLQTEARRLQVTVNPELPAPNPQPSPAQERALREPSSPA
ncbi:MAG TPA: molecular chaperone TorD family protein [Thermoplasmata archaeon]|nr:molecular chaperone TorD family protein [Thermoplasmata archaeon]